MKTIFLAATFILSSFSIYAQNWQLSTDSKIEFKIKNAGITVDGTFSSFQTDINFDPQKLPQSIITGIVEIKSISTNNNIRDNHLKGKDYFYLEKYPKMTFTSNEITFTEKGTYLVKGNLKIRDKVQEVKIPVSFSENEKSRTFKGTFKIDRRFFGVGGWSMILSDKVTVNFTIIELKKI